MTAVNNQVVQMYEDAQLSPEQIAEDLGYDLVAVKATLLQFSNVYRKLVNTAKDEPSEGIENLISDDELREMVDVVKTVARHSEIDSVRLKAACRLIDEKKGRLNPIREVRGAQMNLIMFNQQLIQNRQARVKVLEREKECVEV
jgi:hypothetical protein